MVTVLQYPFEADAQGRLRCTDDPQWIVLQMLALVRDLAGGEFPGIPELANPCDLVEADTEEIIDELARRIGDLFSKLQGLDPAVTGEPVHNSRVLGWINVAGRDGSWRMRIPVVHGEINVILNLDATERICTDV